MFSLLVVSAGAYYNLGMEGQRCMSLRDPA